MELGVKFHPQGAAEVGSLGHSSGFIVKNTKKGLWNLPPRLRIAIEAVCVRADPAWRP